MFKLTLCVGVPNHKSQEFSRCLAVSLAKSLWVQETPKYEILSIYKKNCSLEGQNNINLYKIGTPGSQK